MATTAQLTQDLINAVAKIRMGDGSPMQIKFSDGKTRTIYSDGSGAEDVLGISFRNMGDQFNAATAALKPPAPASAPKPATTPIAQVAPQASTPAPVQQTTPVAQVATKSSSLALPGANPAYFPKVNEQGLPILDQKALDNVLAKYKTDSLNSSQYRDNWNSFGWNVKSDSSGVLHGAAAFGLKKTAGVMGAPTTYSGDFNAAAKQLGVDISGLKTNEQKYNAINTAAKDYYLVSNALDRTGIAANKNAPHASVLFKADGSGNLLPVTNQEGKIAYTPYQGVGVTHEGASGFLSDFGPLLGMAGLAFGIPALMESFGPGVIGAGLPAGTAGAAGLTAAEAAGAAGLGLTSGAGLGTGTMAGTMLGAGTTGAGLAPVLGTTAGIASGLGSAGLLGGEAAGLPLNQVQAFNPSAVTGSANTTGTTSDVIGGGAGAMGTGALGAAGGTAAGNALTQALSNNALYSLLGSGAGALASYLGASGQSDAAKQAAANQMAMFNTINQQLAPQRGAGYSALNQIRSMLPSQYTTYGETGQPTGTAQGTDYLTRQFTPQDLYAGLAPNYQFMLGQGQQAAQRAANVGGGLIGGNALRGLEDYTQNYAQNAYQNAFQNFQNQRTGIYNTLAGIAGLGQQATNTGAQAGQNAVTAAGQLGVGSAAAQAAGLTGAANAAAGGLQNYQQNQILQAILGQNQNVAQQSTATPNFNVG